MSTRSDVLTRSQQELLAILYMNQGETIAFYAQLDDTMRDLGHYHKPGECVVKDIGILGGLYLEELPLTDPSRGLDCRLTKLTGHGAYAAFEFIQTLNESKIEKLENAVKSLPTYPNPA